MRGVPARMGTEDEFVREFPGMAVVAEFVDDPVELGLVLPW
jgi:hypothetical protein